MDREQRKRVTDAYRKWASSYDRLMRSTYHRVERAISRVHLLEHLPRLPAGRLLDAGGGDASWCHVMLEAGRAGSAVLVDLSPDMVRLARRRISRREVQVGALCGDAAALPFPDRCFDTSLALGGVLSHIRSFERAVRELVRVTRPGGHVAVSVDSRAVGVRTARRARDPDLLRRVLQTGNARIFHHRNFPFVVHFFRPEEIRDLLEGAGVEVLSLIGKPVFTSYLAPREVLSEPEVGARVKMELPFLADSEFLPHADQIEVVGRIPES